MSTKRLPHGVIYTCATHDGLVYDVTDVDRHMQSGSAHGHDFETFEHFTWSGQKHLARHGERGKKTRQTEEEVGRQHQGMERPGVHQVPEGSGEQGKMKETGYKIIFGAPMTFTVKG